MVLAYTMLDSDYKDKDEMEVLSDMTEGLRNFAAQYNYAINDPDLIRKYRFFEDGKRDEATRISVAEKRAAKEADRNAKIAVARGLKNDGISPAIIAKNTGLTVEEISNL